MTYLRIITVVLLLTMLFVRLFFLSANDPRAWNEKNIHRTMADVNSLIQAIECYREEKGMLPSRLKDLVPEFLPSLPVPHCGLPELHACFEHKDNRYQISLRKGDTSDALVYFSGTGWIVCK